MKNMILLLTFQVVVQCVLGYDSFLAKFHQNGFKLKDVRLELASFDEKHFNIFEVKTFKYNRTIAAINITLNSKIDLLSGVQVVLQSFKFMSNEYRLFPLRFQVDLLQSYDANLIGIKSGNICGNMTFYFKKNVTYRMCNFVIDETRFPPLIPNGRYRNEMTLMYLNKNISMLNMFGEVYTPIPYPKKKN